ncbi:MAG: 4Fe-4S binding protein [Tannerella sp.]|nr:4Fe-4S binding protein [Tannerella sp.]
MKQRPHLLKVLRVIPAIFFFVPLLFFFLDFTDLLPDLLHRFAKIQLIPAILNGMFLYAGVMLLLTFLFGRLYCSVICPAGILQDIINRIFCIGKKKNKGIRRFRYHKPLNGLRYLLLILTAGLGLAGFMGLCLYLDPYSNFGRIAANLFRPVLAGVNNVLADMLMQSGNYSLYHVANNTFTVSSLIVAGVMLLVFAVMTALRGRLFCNTLCPAGAFLSLFSRYSVFGIAIKQDTCTQCKTCERTCKAEAIHAAEMKVDMSRCVNCFNCISSCRKDSLSYTLRPSWIKAKKKNGKKTGEKSADIPKNNTRRAFIAGSAGIAAALPLAVIRAKQNQTNKPEGRSALPVTPPGAFNLERFKDKCTACHLCVTQCPSNVLKPAGLTYGFGYMLKPYMSYKDSYCNYECTVCSEICPTQAIRPITVEEKKTVQIGIAQFNMDLCIVKTENTDCGACSEHCPTQAVHMIPYEGTLTIPKVEPELCVGCGGCESICPVRPYRAIIIEANETHLEAQKPKEEEALDVDVNDFGF